MKLSMRKTRSIAAAGLSVLLGSVLSSTSFGQLPNQTKTSPINYFGRFHGFGYSDGYHSCPNNQCGPNRSWAKPASFSSFYGEPTAPPGPRFHKPVPSYAAYQPYSQQIDTNVYPHAMPHSTMHSATPSMHPLSSQPQRDYSSAIPERSILLQDSPSIEATRGGAYPSYPDQPAVGTGEMLPPPQPVRTPNQTRRAVPGTTRLYQATLPNPGISRQ
ncbi:MAG: hypothetical protein MUC43_06760 [Pirellula sp.]|jgi:hypothetical protein|nr:hypothetical protein [Pirellula sp.]